MELRDRLQNLLDDVGYMDSRNPNLLCVPIAEWHDLVRDIVEEFGVDGIFVPFDSRWGMTMELNGLS